MWSEVVERIENDLNKGIIALNLEATSEQKQKLLTLLEQLIKWNKTYNLTAIKTPRDGLTLHLLDSLAVLPYIKQGTILDVGTGAGFPGLPLAIMLPNTQFTLLDSNSKKIRFIRQVIHQLKLDNVQVVHSRVEAFSHTGFDGVISRAFASIEDMVNQTRHLLSEGGRWLAMKGQYSEKEVTSVEELATELACHQIEVPGLSAQRCLIELKVAD
jgi:16S rRNA (guanine527-N7)-methyltransferase